MVISGDVAVQHWRKLGVNGTRGHTTCSICALKSHMLQNELTGHITCETCAPEITKWFDAWFLAKTGHALSRG
jgi:hypothetical protein